MTRHPRLLAAATVSLTATALIATGLAPGAAGHQSRSLRLEFRGEATLAAGAVFASTVVGGLSSITYDARRGVYYAISDAQPNLTLPGVTPATSQGPFRLYTLRIALEDGALAAGDVTVLAVTPLTDAAGVALPEGTVDPEGLALTRRGTLIVTSEGFSVPASATTPARAVAPFVREFGLDGRQIREFDLPAYVDPVPGVSGVRNNLGLESAAVTPDGRHLITGFENALAQDGPPATRTTTSPSRLQRFDLRDGELEKEHVYVNEPVAADPVPAGQFTVSGLVEVLALDRKRLLTMERSFSVGAGNTVKLYSTSLSRATDVAGVPDLDASAAVPRPASKRLLLDLATLGLTLDNLEGMTLGPRLPGGGRALVVVSDNNFTPGQVSQFLLFEAGGGARGHGGDDDKGDWGGHDDRSGRTDRDGRQGPDVR